MSIIQQLFTQFIPLSSVIQRVRMGKKVEKALSKDKGPSSASHLEDDNPNKTPGKRF